MTEELNPEFLEFSQMFDEEFDQDPSQVEDEDHKVLLDLRGALKDEQATLQLDPDFARETAEKVHHRYQSLPFLKRLWGDRSALLLSNALRTETVKWSGGLVAAGLGIFALDVKLLGLYGLLLALIAGNAVREELFHLTDGSKEPVREFRFSRLSLYLLPTLAVLVTGLASGAMYARYSNANSDMGLCMVTGFVAGLFAMIPVFKLVERLQATFQNRKRVLFWSQFVFVLLGLSMNYALFGALGYSNSFLVNLSRVLNQERNLLESLTILAAWTLAGAFLIYLAVYIPEKNLPKLLYRSRSGARFEWLGSLFFHLLPVAACISTGLLVGALLYSLGEVSLAFREQQSSTGIMALVGGLGVVFLLRSAMAGLWTAIRKRARTNPKLVATSLLLHGIWFICSITLLVYFAISDVRPADMGGTAAQVTFGAGVFATVLMLVSSFVTYVCTPTYEELPDLKLARRRMRNTMLMSLFPISLALVVFYQMHLTREIYQQKLHDDIQTRVETWVEKYKTMPPEQNGWTLMKKYFLREHENDPEAKEFAEKLSALSKFENGEYNDYQALDQKSRKEFLSGKEGFLELLPLLMEAAEKPFYSHIPTEGFGFEHQVPNFIRERQVSQNLNLLVDEAKTKNDWDLAVDYGLAGLKWSGKGECGSLIEMMIKVSKLAITHSGLEEVVLSGELSDEQLAQLSSALEQANVSGLDFQRCMERETVLFDRFLKIFEDSDLSQKDLENTGLNPLLAYMPDSFWESERKAYWNHQLSRYDNWRELNLSGAYNVEKELNPLNVTTLAFIPNMKRAPVQLTLINSKLSALQVQCALERYKLAHFEYPDKLSQLIPSYLPQLPEDMMKPNKVGQKPTFDYQKTEQGYLLVSNSSVYRRIALKARQVYGHDGNFEERR